MYVCVYDREEERTRKETDQNEYVTEHSGMHAGRVWSVDDDLTRRSRMTTEHVCKCLCTWELGACKGSEPDTTKGRVVLQSRTGKTERRSPVKDLPPDDVDITWLLQQLRDDAPLPSASPSIASIRTATRPAATTRSVTPSTTLSAPSHVAYQFTTRSTLSTLLSSSSSTHGDTAAHVGVGAGW